jgi:hypothetical protein
VLSATGGSGGAGAAREGDVVTIDLVSSIEDLRDLPLVAEAGRPLIMMKLMETLSTPPRNLVLSSEG